MDIAAYQGHVPVGAVAANRQDDGRIFRAADGQGYVFQLHSRRRLAVDSHDDVAPLQSRLAGRAAVDDAGNEHAFVGLTDVHADAGIGASHLLRKHLEFVAGQIRRMLVAQSVYDALHGPVEQGLLVDVAGIMVLYDGNGAEEFKNSHIIARQFVRQGSQQKQDRGDDRRNPLEKGPCFLKKTLYRLFHHNAAL